MDEEKFESLTAMERTVLLASHGRSSAQVATMLGRGVGTIQNHVASARMKLGGLPKKDCARLFHEYEARQKLPGQSLPISFPEPGLADADVDIPSTDTNRVAEERAVFGLPPGDAKVAEGERVHPNDRLTRLTLVLAATALALMMPALSDRLISLYEGVASFFSQHHR